MKNSRTFVLGAALVFTSILLAAGTAEAAGTNSRGGGTVCVTGMNKTNGVAIHCNGPVDNTDGKNDDVKKVSDSWRHHRHHHHDDHHGHHFTRVSNSWRHHFHQHHGRHSVRFHHAIFRSCHSHYHSHGHHSSGHSSHQIHNHH